MMNFFHFYFLLLESRNRSNNPIANAAVFFCKIQHLSLDLFLYLCDLPWCWVICFDFLLHVLTPHRFYCQHGFVPACWLSFCVHVVSNFVLELYSCIVYVYCLCDMLNYYKVCQLSTYTSISSMIIAGNTNIQRETAKSTSHLQRVKYECLFWLVFYRCENPVKIIRAHSELPSEMHVAWEYTYTSYCTRRACIMQRYILGVLVLKYINRPRIIHTRSLIHAARDRKQHKTCTRRT